MRSLRNRSGLSRNELALLAGVGKTTIFDIENDKKSVQLDNVLKAAKVLNIAVKLQSPFGDQLELEL